MCSKSVTGGFRRLQIVSDLSRVSGAASPETLSRIAAGVPGVTPAAVAQVILCDGASPVPDQSVADSVLLGAARPDEDFEAFVACVATLVRDRLCDGPLTADLYWLWESFHDQIALIDPFSRSAIALGLDHAARNGLAVFDPPAFDALLATETPDAVMDALEEMLSKSALPRKSGGMSRDHDPLGSADAPDFVPAAAAVIYGAMQEPARIDLANALWRRHGRTISGSKLGWAAVIRRGMRHLFETNPRFDPWPDARKRVEVTLVPVGLDADGVTDHVA